MKVNRYDLISPVEIARVCHEANRAYCTAFGDKSQLPWDDLLEWQRNSLIYDVEMRLDNRFAPTNMRHSEWMREKLAEGWSYGPVEDAKKNEHPFLLPFDDLPEEQRRKDVLFTAVVMALAPVVKVDGRGADHKPNMKYRKKPVVIEATQWHKNGDHPQDDVMRPFEDTCKIPTEPREGAVVRYCRHPANLGATICQNCGSTLHVHGWIDTLEGGHIVCPGDWIITGIKGEHYPCKPDIFEATYEPV